MGTMPHAARLDLGAEALAREFEIVARLHAEPELGRGAEITGEAERCIGRDRTLAVDDLADPNLRHAQRLRERVLAHPERFQEVF